MIYFDKQSLLQRLQHMEEDNLFRIYLVKEEEQSLELLKKQRHQKLTKKEKEIDDVLKNIAMLEQSKQVLLSKTQYLVQSMNMKESKAQQKEKEEQKKQQEALSKKSTQKEGQGGSVIRLLAEQTGSNQEDLNRFEAAVANLLSIVEQK